MKVKQKLFVILGAWSMIAYAADDVRFPERVVIQRIKNKDCNNDVTGHLEGCYNEKTKEYSQIMGFNLKPGAEKTVKWLVPVGERQDLTEDELMRTHFRTNHSIAYFHYHFGKLLADRRKRAAWLTRDERVCDLEGEGTVYLLLTFLTNGRLKVRYTDGDELTGAIEPAKKIAAIASVATHHAPPRQSPTPCSVSYPGALGSSSWVPGQHPINQGAMALQQHNQNGGHYAGTSGPLPQGLPVPPPTGQAPPPPYSPEANLKGVPVYPDIHEQKKK